MQDSVSASLKLQCLNLVILHMKLSRDWNAIQKVKIYFLKFIQKSTQEVKYVWFSYVGLLLSNNFIYLSVSGLSFMAAYNDPKVVQVSCFCSVCTDRKILACFVKQITDLMLISNFFNTSFDKTI